MGREKEYRGRACDHPIRLFRGVGNEKSPPRNQKRFHSRYNFGYGILLYIRKMPIFRPLTAIFGGFEGIFSYKTDKSAILCPTKTEVADFVSFKGSIVQGLILLDKLEFDYLRLYYCFYNQDNNQ